MGKRIIRNLYTKENIVYNRELGWHYETLDNDCLYSLAPNGHFYPTKILKEDLPEYFVYGRFYKRFGFISTLGVKDIVYKPMKINHSLRDDCIMISYSKPITFTIDKYGHKDYDCDIRVWGCEIIDVLKGIEKYSNYDISKLKEEIWEKMLWLKEHEPDCYEREVGSRERFDKWWE